MKLCYAMLRIPYKNIRGNQFLYSEKVLESASYWSLLDSQYHYIIKPSREYHKKCRALREAPPSGKQNWKLVPSLRKYVINEKTFRRKRMLTLSNFLHVTLIRYVHRRVSMKGTLNGCRLSFNDSVDSSFLANLCVVSEFFWVVSEFLPVIHRFLLIDCCFLLRRVAYRTVGSLF